MSKVLFWIAGSGCSSKQLLIKREYKTVNFEYFHSAISQLSDEIVDFVGHPFIKLILNFLLLFKLIIKH